MSIIIGAILVKMAIGGAKGAALHGTVSVPHGAAAGALHAGVQASGNQILAMESIRNAAGHVLASGSPHLAANAGIGVSHIANAAGVAHAAGVHKAATLTSRHLYETLALGGGVTVANATVDRIVKKIQARAEEISRGPNGKGDWDNWLAAEREVLTRERAAEIAKTSSGTDRDNWLRAEFEVITSQRARGIAGDPARTRGNDYDNWLAGEEEARIVLRAEEISKRNPKAGDLDVWLAAKRELGLA